MRQNKNIQYATFLKKIRTKKIQKSKFDLLKICFLSNLSVNLFNDPCRTITFIVFRDKLQNVMNHYMIIIHAFTSKYKCYIIVSTNMYKKGPIRNDIKYIIRQTTSISKTQCLTSLFKTYKKMKVINGKFIS
jgi:hypothetical protein